jgi:signal transduction histidine kinase
MVSQGERVGGHADSGTALSSVSDRAGLAVVWLACDVEGGPVHAVGVTGEGCLVLATAVLASAAGNGRPSGPAPSLREQLAAAAGRVPAVAAWLASRPEVFPAQVSAGAPSDAQLLLQLAESLVLPGEERSPAGSGPTPATPEASVLRETVRLALTHAKLQEQFDSAVAEARLEAMRELAYGAGHEINNPLANIATRAQALLLDEADPERRRRLSTIVDQSFRARDMIGGLMLFARPPKPRREPVDVGKIVASTIEAVRGLAATRGVRLEYSPLPAPLDIFVDRLQIEEAIRVVLVNALEAVAVGGRVVLDVIRRPAGAAGWCEVAVADDGRGMSFDTARRAFDPFFSGREAGRGAGLGLSKAWRLIELNGGSIALASRPGQGTRVTIQLPEALAAADVATSVGA